MKYINTLSIILGVAFLTSCVKHEVIPKPTYEAKLPISFTGNIQGANYTIIEDIKGFYCKPSQAKEILPSPQPSKIAYYSSLESGQQQDMIQVRLGKLIFSSNNADRPSIEDFNEFFKTGITTPIEYKTDSEDGVEVVFRDSQGTVWMSSETSIFPQTFELSNLEEDSDEEGQYMKFVAKFSLSLYDNLLNPVLSDTIEIQNAIFQGYFKR
ncbi:hypothetical protein ERX46_01000 [Brumimicrobium glaciale]|jgi:hypothetical protein|uniref:Lipoprotein n=1 Tax=Brumimicrobium glaciale TaxID=200475 RepID=A0A4Q4KQC2_9FLAO|nr:hypothetical protein [Brumimicrobium glaciale]RYM35597.1 hypothetical protein ERX46_01000 [Brumimicrobium glaciale]